MSGPQVFWREGRDIYQRCGPDGAAAQSAPTLRSDHPRTAHRWAWWWPTSAHRLTESLPLATTSWWQPAHPMRRGPRSRRAALGKNTVKTCQPSGSSWCVSRTSRSRELTVFHIRAPPQLLTCFSGARHAQFSYLTKAGSGKYILS